MPKIHRAHPVFVIKICLIALQNYQNISSLPNFLAIILQRQRKNLAIEVITILFESVFFAQFLLQCEKFIHRDMVSDCH